ncbi:branched-chain amino acid ABC transporter permease [Aeromicrobium chenweiae]|uniref:Amino acid ABC transporter permease n=1 Tax=Aeromicrobium chenweiae TaxID=2079793 RepID=A0A2S0WIV9_9ACTN|nr:branched-chain amino acid ABC transporter permease [Aeromicrobium chenweiae]AWB91263.1 amino acid ABC transporter permease [Aeromicrobium chenweiae]TGN31781.1 branched-chain amino acid ABC transporter permease [Aeromicrobium chenweiae]
MLQLLSSALILGSIYLLFSMGLSLSWGVLNILNLAHGSIFMFGAFSAYLITREVTQDIHLAVLAVIAALVGGALSVLLQVLVYHPLQRRTADAHSAELGVLIASIGAGLIPVTVALNLSTDEVVNLPAGVVETQIHVFGSVRITTLQIGIVIVSLVLAAALSVFVARTRTGRAMRTIAADPVTADIMGIPVARLSALTMFISGALAGTAGLLLAANANAIEAHMGDGLLLKAFAAVVLGGVGSIPGAAVGAFALALGETFAVEYFGGDAKDFVAFGLIIVVLLLRPQGIFTRAAGQRA